jgi:hypothetical protein
MNSFWVQNIQRSTTMTPAKNYRKPTARREQVSLRLDSEAAAFIDKCWAPGLSFRSSRAEAVIRILASTRDFVDFAWGRVKGNLTSDDLWHIASGIQGSDQTSAWRWLSTAISDPEVEPLDPQATAVAEKVNSWDAGTRFAVVIMVEWALAAAYRANPEWAVLGAFETAAIQREFEALLQ